MQMSKTKHDSWNQYEIEDNVLKIQWEKHSKDARKNRESFIRPELKTATPDLSAAVAAKTKSQPAADDSANFSKSL